MSGKIKNFYGEIETDTSVETTGIFLGIGPNLAAKIARAGGANVKFEKAREHFAKPYMRQMQQGLMNVRESTTKVLKPAYARGVVLDFFAMIDGKPVSGIPPHPSWGKFEKADLNEHGLLPVTEENVLRLFNTPELSAVWDTVVEEADRNANFRKEDLDARVGN
jgi:hypothetical protein